MEIIALVAVAPLLLPVPVINISITALILVSAYLYVIINSMKAARLTTDNYELKKYNKWYFYLVIVLISTVMIHPVTSWATKRFYIQSYRIPSGAMIPTLEIGDHIITNKFIYNFSKPKHEDIIIFDFPKEPNKQFIKRVVAIEGDKVEIRSKQLFINDKKIKADYIVHKDSKVADNARDNFGPVTVPDESIFVLGDNRDQSYDSRFWGFVNLEAVNGKAQTIYWSWDKENTAVRWNRIGQLLK